MKYILKKDLPFAKVGTEVRYFYGTTIEHINFNRENNTVDIHIPMKESIAMYFEDGWIEEVKPREWEVWLSKGQIHSTLPIMSDAHTLIRVREVVECI